MERIKNWIRQNPKEFIVLVAILLAGSFFRLYKIDQYMTFLGDEGRDVIIVRRIFTELHPPLIGPGTSIGHMYLGPIYYYMMAPALILANFSPVGPAVMVAVLGVITIFLVWFIGREWFGKAAGVIASLLYAISPTVIIYSRSSWNPNIMPFFALLCIYSMWRVWKNHEWKWLIVLGASYAFVLQSHYLGLLLLPTFVLFWLLSKAPIRQTIYGAIIFLILMSPLVIFDIRHGWHNFTAMKEFFTARQSTVSIRPWNAIPNLAPISQNILERLPGGRNMIGGAVLGIVLLIGVIFILIKYKKSIFQTPYFLLFSWILFALLGLGLYKQQIYDHYYGFIFAAPFLLLGGIGSQILSYKNKIINIVLFLGIALLVFINLQNSPILGAPNMQLQRAETVAAKVAQESGGQRFNLAVLAERNYEDGYKYFLLKDGLSVVDIDAQNPGTITNQLFVVCEMAKEKCNPINNPKAEVANFGWSKIDSQWDTFGVTIYKLIHLVQK